MKPVSFHCTTLSGLLVIILVITLACPALAADGNPAPGYIQVYSTPSGATAYVDGYLQMITPASFTVQSETYHTVNVYLSGYQSYSQTVYVPAGQPVIVTAQLSPVAPDTGGLSVTSTPLGADIYIDGIYEGETAQVIGRLQPGSHILNLQKAGYFPYTVTFNIVSGQITSLSPTLSPNQPQVGSIEVTSQPTGAAVYLDNAYKGTTHPGGPFDIIGIAPGFHTIRLELTDYQPYTRQVQVFEGGIEEVSATLTPVSPGPQPDTTGQLYVSSTPSGAEVFVDNVFLGITPVSLSNITAGTHTVMLQMQGYSDWTGTAQVTAGQSSAVAASLTALPQTTRAAAGGLVAMIGVIGAGYLVLLRKE